MSHTNLKKLVLYGALAMSPALLSAQGITGDTTSPVTNPDQATLIAIGIVSPMRIRLQQQQDRVAYQRELEACDRQPSEQDACRAKVDEKYTSKMSTTPGRAADRPETQSLSKPISRRNACRSCVPM